ncbi:unnamed protein product [Schistosoma turkestanicum]|nr:unnamed protein product [Schistosoma turkestanicum]
MKKTLDIVYCLEVTRSFKRDYFAVVIKWILLNCGISELPEALKACCLQLLCLVRSREPSCTYILRKRLNLLRNSTIRMEYFIEFGITKNCQQRWKLCRSVRLKLCYPTVSLSMLIDFCFERLFSKYMY